MVWRRGDEALSMFIVHAGKLEILLPKGSSGANGAVSESSSDRVCVRVFKSVCVWGGGRVAPHLNRAATRYARVWWVGVCV